MTGRRLKLDPRQNFTLSSQLRLVVMGEDNSGFAAMRLVDEDGDSMAVTMNELLNAISAAYYCQKDLKK